MTLLQVLLGAGVLTRQQATAAESDLAGGKETLIDWLGRHLLMGEEELARMICEVTNVPYVSLPAQALNPAVTRLLPEDLCNAAQIVPLRAPEGSLVVATANPLNAEARRQVELATNRQVRFEVTTQTAIRDALRHAYHLGDTLDSYLEEVPDEVEGPIVEAADDDADIGGLLHASTDDLAEKLFNVLLTKAVSRGASDIHVEPSAAELRVRYRVAGERAESFHLPKWLHAALIARCKQLAKLDAREHSVPQSKRITLSYQGRSTCECRACQRSSVKRRPCRSWSATLTWPAS
jgi:type IV pilus assembly protein PilB